MLLIGKQEGCFKSLEEWRKIVAHVVQLSAKEWVQENNILGTWCQNLNSRKGNEECAWFRLISWVHGYWTHFNSERWQQGGPPALEEEQASWKEAKAKDTSAMGLASCRRQRVYAECHHEVDSKIRNIMSYKSSQAEVLRGRSLVRTLLCREALPMHPADHLVICSYAISSVSQLSQETVHTHRVVFAQAAWKINSSCWITNSVVTQDCNFRYVIGRNSSFSIHSYKLPVFCHHLLGGDFPGNAEISQGLSCPQLALMLLPILPCTESSWSCLVLPGLFFNQSWPEWLTLKLNRIEISTKDKQLVTVASGLAP